MKYIIFLIVTLWSITASAATYSVDDFYYYDNNKNVITCRLSPKIYVNKNNPNISVSFIVDNYKESIESVEDADNYNFSGTVIAVKGLDTTLKILDEFDEISPIIKKGNRDYLVYNILVCRTSSFNKSDVEAYLNDVFHLDFNCNEMTPGVFYISVYDFGNYKNVFLLMRSLMRGTFFDSVELWLYPMDKLSSNTYMVDAGAGTIGEKRKLKVDLIVPKDAKLGEIPHLNNESIISEDFIKTLPNNDINYIRFALSSIPAAQFAVPKNFIDFDEPIVQEKIVGEDKHISIVYPFYIYNPGSFLVVTPEIIVEIMGDHRGEILTPVSFTVVPLLNQNIKDIQYIPHDTTCKIELPNVDMLVNGHMILIFTCLFVSGFCFWNMVTSLRKKPEVVVDKPVSLKLQILSDISDNNWKSKYHQLLGEMKDETIPAELLDELEKAYNDKAIPDLTKVKEWVSFMECK